MIILIYKIKEKIENYFLNAFKKGDSKATHINDADFDYQRNIS